jgi:hypothetical protein
VWNENTVQARRSLNLKIFASRGGCARERD